MSRERKGVEQSDVAIKCSLNLYVELSVGEKLVKRITWRARYNTSIFASLRVSKKYATQFLIMKLYRIAKF